MSTGIIYIDLALMATLLLFSSIFSGAETAFFSLNSLEKEALRRHSTGGSNRIIQLLFTDPDQVLVTILTGNMFVNIFASSLSEAIGSRVFVRSSELYSIVSMTLILLLVGEMTPKNIAVRHSLRFARFSARILRHVHTLLKPVTIPLGHLRDRVISIFPGRPDLKGHRDEAILSAIRIGHQSETIEESELLLLERFFRFRKKNAVDVMIPRVDSRPVDASITIGEFLRDAAAGRAAVDGAELSAVPGGSSRLIPLYRDDVDHITGYIRLSCLLPYRLKDDLALPLSRLRLPVHAVPRGKDLRELLDEMGELKTEMAVVVDDYGGTEGIVTFESVMKYLFEDFAAARDRPIIPLDEYTFRVSGQTDLREVEAVLRIKLPRESRTLGGMVTEILGDLPREGSSVVVGGYRFTVEEVSGRRIAWLLAQFEKSR